MAEFGQEVESGFESQGGNDYEVEHTGRHKTKAAGGRGVKRVLVDRKTTAAALEWWVEGVEE